MQCEYKVVFCIKQRQNFRGELSRVRITCLAFFYIYALVVLYFAVAVDRAPNFSALPNKSNNEIGEQHKGTIHLNCEHMQLVHLAYMDAVNGIPSKLWVKIYRLTRLRVSGLVFLKYLWNIEVSSCKVSKN